MKLPIGDSESDGPNMTPMIDVVFQLLIFFLVGSRMQEIEREMNTVLPEVTQARPLTAAPQEVVVNITREGRYKVMQKELTEDQLLAVLTEARRKNPGKQSVLICGDGETAWKKGVRVMGLCNKAGITDYRVAAVQEK